MEGFYFIELDEPVTIRSLFLRAYGHAWFRTFSIFDAAFECLFDSLRHIRRTNLLMLAQELSLWFGERFGALVCALPRSSVTRFRVTQGSVAAEKIDVHQFPTPGGVQRMDYVLSLGWVYVSISPVKFKNINNRIRGRSNVREQNLSSTR
jgi:hypothetical protein